MWLGLQMKKKNCSYSLALVTAFHLCALFEACVIQFTTEAATALSKAPECFFCYFWFLLIPKHKE